MKETSWPVPAIWTQTVYVSKELARDKKALSAILRDDALDAVRYLTELPQSEIEKDLIWNGDTEVIWKGKLTVRVQVQEKFIEDLI